MDKQTKIIFALLALVLVLTVVFTLKLTGVIKKTEYKPEDNIETNQQINLESLFSNMFSLVLMIAVLIVVIIGIYKAYVKLGIPAFLLQISFFVLPILHIVLSFGFISFITIQYQVILIIMAILTIIEVIVFLIISSSYFKCLDMSGAIPLLALVPIITSFIPIPFIGIISLVASIALLIYGVISIERLAKFFNKGTLFAVGIFFLPFIFIPILGYSKNN